MNKIEHFSTPIYFDLKHEWVEKLIFLTDPYIEYSKNKEKENIEKRIKEDGYKNDIAMSYHSDDLESDTKFDFLHKYIAEKSKYVLDDMGYDMDSYNLIYTESWVQEFSHNGGGGHWFHTHANSHITAFLFLKSSDKTSRPMFQDPRTSHLGLKLKEKDMDKVTNASDIVNYSTTPGTLMLFPSYLSHAYSTDHGIEPFRFMHFNLRAIEKELLRVKYDNK